MISSVELQNDIGKLTCSKEALVEFARRIAIAMKAALKARDVMFHAINDGTIFSVGSEFNQVAKVCLLANSDETWTWTVSDSLGSQPEDSSETDKHPTTITDNELTQMAMDWANIVKAKGSRVAFGMMYVPKSVDFAEGYNDLEIAFRVLRAWDPVYSRYIVRIDSVYKVLGQ